MPTYTYRCVDCGFSTRIGTNSPEDPRHCPRCGKELILASID